MPEVNPLTVAKLIQKWAEANPENFGDLISILMSNKGMADKIRHMIGHVGVENPQENWEKLLYTPTTFKSKKVKDKDGNVTEVPLSDEEKRKAVWNGIQFRNIGGDVAMGTGALGTTLANMNAQQLKGAARNSASDRQRELYGATPTDRAAAAAVPMYQALSALSSTISGLIANRFYQGAAERRAAYLQSLMDSEYNNMGMPGQYADARRHAADVIPNSSPSIGGQQ